MVASCTRSCGASLRLELPGRWGARAVAALLAVLCLTLAAPAGAGELTRPDQLDLVLFRPGPGATDFLGLRGGRLAPAWTPSLGLTVGTAARLFQITLRPSGIEGVVVQQQVDIDVLAALAVSPWFELGVALPVVPSTALGDGAALLPAFDDVPDHSTAVGDLRLSAKLRLPDPTRGLALALDLTVALPTGGSFAGHDGPTVTPTAVIDAYVSPVLRLVGNVGVAFRARRSLGPLVLDDALLAALGVELTPASVAAEHAVRGEVAGFVGLTDPGAEERGVEVRAGYAWRGVSGLELGLGFGLGIGTGVGVPQWRAFGSVRYRPGRCATGPEDDDGWEDDDDCADLDNDGDGLDDDADLCPNEPENRNGFEDGDGCPDHKPAFPAFGDGGRVALVAPGDADHDGLDDDIDACPEEAEDRDGFEDGDGCPEPDNDQDGVLDGDDACPRSAEVVNGFEDEDGCPDVATMTVTTRGIVLGDTVRFLPGSATLDHRSDALLDSLAAVLYAHPEILRLEVAGHTDSAGSDRINQVLSEQRAGAVRDYLIGRGIAPDRLTAAGYGEGSPIAPNTTPHGRRLNRRVELTILELALPPGNAR
ncbi:MAG: cell envelope biogenesis protein OmpA [Deltaproteobacteria bacterium HGW-Deltaproteobacteria-14]|jgi:outer membrane protein OmpA-like peptidoglycan-associated protein|nr:MAG: cell envelope biogenesis protein OmpA [Deltaproteobacteria bacterium HGW-Deltaproteobacteria-14]